MEWQYHKSYNERSFSVKICACECVWSIILLVCGIMWRCHSVHCSFNTHNVVAAIALSFICYISDMISSRRYCLFHSKLMIGANMICHWIFSSDTFMLLHHLDIILQDYRLSLSLFLSSSDNRTTCWRILFVQSEGEWHELDDDNVLLYLMIVYKYALSYVIYWWYKVACNLCITSIVLYR